MTYIKKDGKPLVKRSGRRAGVIVVVRGRPRENEEVERRESERAELRLVVREELQESRHEHLEWVPGVCLKPLRTVLANLLDRT